MTNPEDHERLAQKLRTEIYRKMTHAQKWEEVKKLWQTARTIKAAGVRHAHPDWTEERVEEEVKRIFLYATT